MVEFRQVRLQKDHVILQVTTRHNIRDIVITCQELNR